MASLTTVFFLVWTILDNFTTETTKHFYLVSPAIKFIDLINYSLMFRFVRVQVQLKAAEENSKKIMAAIEQSKKVERFVYADLLLYIVTKLSNYIVKT